MIAETKRLQDLGEWFAPVKAMKIVAARQAERQKAQRQQIVGTDNPFAASAALLTASNGMKRSRRYACKTRGCFSFNLGLTRETKLCYAFSSCVALAEDDGAVPMVKLGDASVASPFTSKKPSIQSTIDVIRQVTWADLTERISFVTLQTNTSEVYPVAHAFPHQLMKL